ncbi:MAG: FAD-dependent oxidoreductase [Candidatus Omnitrophota bacterium]
MKHIVIIGNSAAGVSAAEAIRKIDSNVKITIFTDEHYPAYYRYLIADMLTQKFNEKDVYYKQKGFYDNLGVRVEYGKKIEKVVPVRNYIMLLDKTKISYDCLVVATGKKMKLPREFKGANKHGVIGFDSIENVRDILELLPITNTVSVWGGNIAGLTAACALSQKINIEVKLILGKQGLLPGIVDARGAELIIEKFKAKGIEVISDTEIVEVFGDTDVKAVKLDTGKVIGCGILIVDKYLVPQTKILQESEIAISPGIIVDKFLRTNVPSVFAAGDVIACTGEEKSWQRALFQGEIAGYNAMMFLKETTEQMIEYKEVQVVKKLEFFDLPLTSSGIINKFQDDNLEELIFAPPEIISYNKIILRDSKIAGFLELGESKNSEVYVKLMQLQADISNYKNDLFTERFNAELVKDLIA